MTTSPVAPRHPHRIRHVLARLGALVLLGLAGLVGMLAVMVTLGISDEYGLTTGDVIAIWTPAVALIALFALGGRWLWHLGR